MRQLCLGVALALVLGVCASRQTSAESLTSNSLRFEESVIGTNGFIEANSANFRATGAAGDIAIGNAASSNYQFDAGTKTSPDPALTLAISNGSVDLGSFSPSVTATATTTFSVINYTTYGYIVQLYGSPPSDGVNVIDPLTSSSPSVAGTEQFGINLVANTSPTTFGANLDNGDFGYGQVSTNYDVANEFRFVSGETIAEADKNSGQTIYTISYIVNVRALTPAGLYTGDQTLVVTGTY